MGGAVFDPSGVANSKAMEAVLGDGYAAEQERTFRRHRYCMMSKLRDICGDNTRRQLDLVQGCLGTFQAKKELRNQGTSARQVLQGISDTLEKIKLLHGSKGSTPHDLNVAQQTLQAAALSKVEHVQSAAVQAMMSTSNKHQLLAAHQRGKAFLEADSEQLLPYDKAEAACNKLNPEWAAKVESMWLSGTRPSESKKDESKNPKDRSDPRTYRTRTRVGANGGVDERNWSARSLSRVPSELLLCSKRQALFCEEAGQRIFLMSVPHGVAEYVPCTEIVEPTKHEHRMSP